MIEHLERSVKIDEGPALSSTVVGASSADPGGFVWPRLDVQAAYAYIACMQYTLRNVPPAVDRALRERARREGRSLNEVAIDLLRHALGQGDKRIRHRSLRDVRGSWHEDPVFDEAIADQDRVDEELWK